MTGLYPRSASKGARQEDGINLREVWNLLIRNWLVIAFCFVACVGAAASYTYYTVPVYQSVTSIQIEEERSDIPVLDILQTLSTGSEVETEMEVLRSRTLAEEVVDSLGLQVHVEAPRGVARTVLMGAIYVEPWAPEAVYRSGRAPGRHLLDNPRGDSNFGRYRGDSEPGGRARRDLHASGGGIRTRAGSRGCLHLRPGSPESARGDRGFPPEPRGRYRHGALRVERHPTGTPGSEHACLAIHRPGATGSKARGNEHGRFPRGPDRHPLDPAPAGPGGAHRVP